jgi:hypothetical protein
VKLGFVSFCEFPSQVGGESPFNVDVELDLGERLDKLMVVCEELRPEFPTALRRFGIWRMSHGVHVAKFEEN